MSETLNQNHEQQRSLQEKQKWARELKVLYMNEVSDGKADARNYGELRQSLIKLIGNENLPPMANWQKPEAMQAWVDLDLNDPANVSPNSEIGKQLEKNNTPSNEVRSLRAELNDAVIQVKGLITLYRAANGDLLKETQIRRELSKLIGEGNVEEVILDRMSLTDPRIDGTVREIMNELADVENGEISQEKKPSRPADLLKKAVGLLYAESGRLRGAEAVDSIKKSMGNRWESIKNAFGKAKEKFFGKKEAAVATEDPAFADELQGDDELATEEEVSAWEALKERAKKSPSEISSKVRELLKGGAENAEKLAVLISTDQDVFDQVVALGFNIALRGVIGGPLVPVISKVIMDNRAINRAEKAGELGDYVKNRYQTGTNREQYRAGLQEQQQAATEQELAEYQKLEDEAVKLESALAAAKGKYKWKKGIAEGRGIKKQETRDKYQNEILPALQAEVDAAQEKYNEFFDGEKGAIFAELVMKLEGTEAVQQARAEKADTLLAKSLKIAGRVARRGADVLAIYANVGKKFAIDAQGAGNTVDAFIKKSSVDRDPDSPETAATALNAVDALAAKLTPDQIQDRVAKKDKTLLADINQLNDLLAALIDLGIIGDVIPRNIGHKQINGVLKKLPFLNRMAGQEGLFRDAGFVAELRKKVLAQAAVIAEGLNDASLQWDKMSRGVRNGLDDLAEMGGMNADKYRAGRERDMAGALRNADIFAMFAGAGIVYAAGHLEDARKGAESIQAAFSHETELATAPNSPGLSNIAENAASPNRPDTRVATNPDSPDQIRYSDRRDAVQIDTGRRVDYTSADGRIMYQNGQPVGIDQQGNVTPDYAAANMATAENVSGTLDEQLFDDISRYGIDTATPNGLVNYVLRPLARDLNFGTFTAQELQVAADMYAANPTLYQGGNIDAIARAVADMRR